MAGLARDDASAARRARAARAGARRESALATATRLGDCLLVGVCVAVASLGVVTAGPALAAAARVTHGWESGDQPPIVGTFLATVRTETRRLLGPQLALAAALAVGWFDLVAAGHGLPGATVFRVVVAALAGFAVASFLAAFPTQAATGAGWWTAWADAARLCARRPWLPVAVLATLAAAALLVAALPPIAVAMAGPVTLGVGVLTSRARRAGAEGGSGP